MITFSMITGALTWLLSNLWVLLIALVPAVLGFFKPVLEAVMDGLKGFLSTVWEGMKSMNFQEWMVVLTAVTVAGVAGYHIGWQACIDWVHAHFHLRTKVLPHAWWKFW